MRHKVVIKGLHYGKRTAPGWNDRLAASAKHPQAGGKMEREFVNLLAYEIRYQLRRLKIKNPVRITYTFHEPDLRRDVGNIAYVSKPFEDALQITGVLENDNQKWIKEQHFIAGEVDKKNPRIEIVIEEIDEVLEGLPFYENGCDEDG